MLLTRPYPIRAIIFFSIIGSGIILGALLIWNSVSDRGTLAIHIALTNIPPDEQLTLTVSSIDLWDVERGWYTVDDRVRTLSTVHSSVTLESTAEHIIRTGSYDRVRLVIERIERINATDEQEPLYTLLDTIVLTIPITIEQDATSALLVTLPVDESLYTLGEARSVFIPQLHAESRTRITTLQEDTTRTITGGTLQTNQTFGMTADGSMRAQYRLPKDTTFSRVSGGLQIESLPATLTPVERIERMLAEEALNAEATTSDSVRDSGNAE